MDTLLDLQKITFLLKNRYSNCQYKYIKKYIKLLFSDYSGKNFGAIEKHHILPKSLFPEFSKVRENIIAIPSRVHFIAHSLLVKIYPKCGKMAEAFLLMSKNNLIKNSSIYEKCQQTARQFRKERALKLVKDGVHNLLGSSNPVHKQIYNDTHLFSSINSPIRVLARQGKHPMTEISRLGKHPATLAKQNGTIKYKGIKHHYSGRKPWDSPNVTELSNKTYSLANLIYNIYIDYPTLGRRTFQKKVEKILNIKCSTGSITSMLNHFKNKWIPSNDPEWLKFKQNYKPNV